jgi:hypothetical protein
MLGAKLDYMLLRPLTHERNRETEEEINEDLLQDCAFDLSGATARLSKLFTRLEGHFPINSSLRYLDIACGTGDITLRPVDIQTTSGIPAAVEI